jgi:hypothetical protein
MFVNIIAFGSAQLSGEDMAAPTSEHVSGDARNGEITAERNNRTRRKKVKNDAVSDLCDLS